MKDFDGLIFGNNALITNRDDIKVEVDILDAAVDEARRRRNMWTGRPSKTISKHPPSSRAIIAAIQSGIEQ